MGGKTQEKIWTHDVCLVLDVQSEEKEAGVVKLGSARLSGSDFVVELVPGVSVSGRIVLRLREAHHGF